MNKLAIGSIFLILLVAYSNAASPLFISAITSALATIPFSGGPMTTGLVGAKLGIGTKLLYYLGYFGRKAPSTPKKKAPASPKLPSFGDGGFSSQPFQSTSSRFPNSFPISSNFQNSFGGVDPSQLFQALTAQGVDPNVVIEALNYAGGMNPTSNAFATNAAFGGFGTGGPFGAGGSGSMNPASNAFATNAAFGGFGTGGSFGAGGGSGGMNPASNAFATNAAFGGFGTSGSFGAAGSDGMNSASNEFATNAVFGTSGSSGATVGSFPPASGFSSAIPAQQLARPQGAAGGSLSQPIAPETPSSENELDDAESFFNFLQDMDENTCISRLICDIGNSPSFLGEFSENISSMVSSLKVPPTSRAYKYIEIMEQGKKGQCKEKFPECGDMSYEVVKNVAPSVSLPQNVNSVDINF